MYKDLLKVNTKELYPNYRQPKEGKYMIIDVFVCLNVNRDMAFSRGHSQRFLKIIIMYLLWCRITCYWENRSLLYLEGRYSYQKL